MKKTKLTVLIALILALVTALSSCGSVASVKDILNTKYDTLENVWDTEAQVPELSGYFFTKVENDLALFASVEIITTETPNVSYKIFNLDSRTVVASFTDTAFSYNVEFIKNAPAFIVEKSSKADTSTDKKTTYTLYDATGKEITTTEFNVDNSFMITKDTLVYNYVIYSADEAGALTKEADVPEYVILNNLNYYTEDYYYIFDNDGIAVYDKAFNLVSTYFAPSYSINFKHFVLNDGNILVQYTYEVDEDSKKYDIDNSSSGKSQKLNLVTLIVSAKNGKTTEINVDYIINDLYSLEELCMYNEDSRDMLSKKVKNIAIISSIIDKKIDNEEAHKDIVLMNNKGKIEKSLKIVDNQACDLPQKVGEDRYMVSTLTGQVLMNEKGKVLQNLNNQITPVGVYFVGSRAIYDMDLELVYDFAENKAKEYARVANTVFVKAETETGYDIILFCNGEQKTVYSHNNNDTSSVTFKAIDGIGYCLENPTANEYKYFNANGDLICTTSYALTAVCSSSDKDSVLLVGMYEAKTTYRLFTVAE